MRNRNTDSCTGGSTCRSRSLNSLRAIVDDYIAEYRPRPWVAFHKNQPSLERALEVVATWKNERGKTYSHQSLISRAAKAGAGERIRKLRVADVEHFEQLFQRVQKAIGSIRGIGDLAVYDAAARIGAFLKKMPARVYLQQGVKDGARALGFGASQRSLPMDFFPAELRRLEPWEVEDLLCIYKDELGRLPRRGRAAA